MLSRGQQTVSDRNTGKEGTVLLQAVGVGQVGGPERTTVATNSNREFQELSRPGRVAVGRRTLSLSYSIRQQGGNGPI